MEERDEFTTREEQEAAREAGAIGGRAGDEDLPPAERPVREAGGGEAEGFEQAEEDLVDHAEYTSGEGTPRMKEFDADSGRPDPATYGEPDEEDVRD